MNMSTVTNMDLQICRLCLARTSVHFCLITNAEIFEMLQSVTSLHVPSDDNISTVICYKCKLNLKLAYKIQQNMLAAERRFYEQIQIKAEKIEAPDKLNIPNDLAIEDEIKCNECDKFYDSKVGLQRHIARVHAVLDGPPVCEICQKTFLNKSSLKSHIYINHSGSQGEHKCDICDKFFPNIPRLNKHKLHHVQNECKICGKIVRAKVMKEHMADHGIDYDIRKIKKAMKMDAAKEYKCNKCDKKFDTARKRWNHMNKIHNTPIGRVECPICQKSFATKISLADHKRDHLNTGPHPCDVCNQVFTSKKRLYKHKLGHKRVKCTVCDQEIVKTHLHQHMLIHGDKQICDICGFQSTTKLTLQIHKRRKHGNPTLYKCQYCEKTFTTKTNKDHHEKSLHLGVKSVQCEQCGKKFFNNQYLKRHFDAKHLKITKNFKCAFCEKEFASEYSLKTHKRIHTNETPFKCDICNEGFRQKVSLKNHLKSKHNIEEKLTDFCKTCGKGFGSMVALQTHRRVHE